MIHTLYISYDGMTDPLGQSQVIPYLEGLTKAGYAISLISFEKPEQASRKQFITDLMAKAGIDWHPLTYTKFPPVFSTLKDIRAMKQLAFSLHQKHPFQIVHCRSYIAALAGLAMKRKLGVRFVFDMRGFWADERVEGGIWNTKNPAFKWAYRYFKKKEVQFFSEADYTISLTHNGKKEIHAWHQIAHQPIPIKVIPCCVDTSLFDPTRYPDKSVIKNEIGLGENNFVLTYLGSIGTWYMLPETLRFFSLLLKVKPSAKFLFITGDNPDHIIQEATRQGVPKERLLIVKAQREDVPKYLKASDASIFFIKPVFSKKASSPTKQGEIMSMEIPIICNTQVGDTDYVIDTYRAGFLLKTFSTDAYQDIIMQLDELLNLDKANLRAGAETFYSLKQGIKSYQEVYQEVLKS